MSEALQVTEELQETFRSMPVDMLRMGAPVRFDIYMRLDAEDAGKPRYALLGKAGQPLTRRAWDTLRRCGARLVYVQPESASDFKKLKARQLRSVLTDESIDEFERTQILYTSVQETVKDFLAEPRAREMVGEGRHIVETTREFLNVKKHALRHLLKLTGTGYEVYTHSVNVFVFALCLAQRVIPNDFNLNDFGVGALLHDIGKAGMEPALLNPKESLSPEQRAQIALHPIHGYRTLVRAPGVGRVALDVIRHHHERVDGTGYPDRLRNREVTVYARILAIADIFDSLTTPQMTRGALSSYDALAFMCEEMSTRIDMDLYVEFVKMFGGDAS